MSQEDPPLRDDNCFNNSFDSDVVFSDLSDEDYDNSTYETDESESTDTDLKTDIRNIVLEGKLTQKLSNKLLSVLRKHGHNELPKDRRTLLKTPRNTSLKLESVGEGQYYHFGLECCIKRLIETYCEEIPDSFRFNVSVDGLPLAKSSGKEFWPIMISFVCDFYTEPMVVGLYHGDQKPSDANEYLRRFVDDYLQTKHFGVNINGKIVRVSVNCIICDAPAKSFVAGIKGHSGYFGCPRCIQEGEHMNGRMTFPEISSALRTDTSFRTKLQSEHHNNYTRLEELLEDMIIQIPFDYMHAVCLGVMRRLIWFWLRGPFKVKLSPDTIEKLSRDLVNLKQFITVEFARKPRPLTDIGRWKATESRQFLLYTGM